MNTKLCGITENYDEVINEAAALIAAGEIVSFPTETVYGLGADAMNEDAVKHIFEAKGRPQDNPLIVHIADKEQLCLLTDEITDKQKALMDAFWPGPFTIILKKRQKRRIERKKVLANQKEKYYTQSICDYESNWND